ncbi:MAG: DUF4332 domain-containing protein, partial [Planctomycetota bacterium]
RRQLESALERFTDFESNHARRELAEVESQMRVAEDRERLQDEIHQLEAELATVHEHWVHAPVTQRAAETLDRLSGGQLVGVRVEGTAAVMVEDARGVWTAAEHLSRGARDQLHLAFCMAIIAALRDRGVELPLILNDAFVNVDSRRDQVLADVITDFARQGFQVVLFTRHQHVARIFEGLHARLFELGAQLAPIVTPVETQAIEQVRFRQVDHRQQHQRVDLPQPSRRGTARPRTRAYENVTWENEPAAEPMPAVRADAILPTTPLDHLDLLDGREAAAFRAIRVVTVGDLLDSDATMLGGTLARAGLAERPIIRWQDELALCVHIPGLALADARMLVATGIGSLQELSVIDAEALCQRVERYLASGQARAGYSSPLYRLSRERAASWVRTARTVYRRNAAGETGRFSQVTDESTDVDWHAHRSVEQGRPDDRSRRGAARRRSRGDGTTRAGRSGLDAASTRTQGETRRDVAARLAGNGPAPKFYLDASDPVVEAPSIGPKTAERLKAAGILTVHDLLQAEPQQAAAEVAYARITPTVIEEWQAQALLACRVPMLRGHDAQILVACDLTRPEHIADMAAEDIWSRVRPFLKTNEGKRIIRNGKQPDLSEVRDWVAFAQQARSLSSAG